ncbi:DNA alkylation repair protein [Rickettsiales endosymbiont of Peranema trichophorum]|uniref:DNA alkylation repair protein n=1 Tax=Rickettsiales endosymbiont of Peranema trichophorum TaxID=2486577 RepID=UPI001022F644|nr:DNA alkylation repair protein [Rickettsiales endosymbiont of Peranema trichophorum]RZI47264.1 DNA alkylation repair protein [Rickettsiales endosymbiont of Peranema trichophorum]
MSNLVVLKIVEEIRTECAANITLDPVAAKRFFKVSEGSYGAGDAFLGVTVPNLRRIAKIYKNIELEVIKELLHSKYNEERLLALLILVHQYQKGDVNLQEKMCSFYINNLDRVNNWNLVDSSAHHILGHHLWDKDRSMLTKIAASDVLWERRIAIVATWYFIQKSDLEWTFRIAKLLGHDLHDLIHKAVGWMLREAGKKDEAQLISFLAAHGKQMPKTTLRYAMERLSKEQKAIATTSSISA